MWKKKSKSHGSATIEVCLTLPIVIYLMFFCLELVKINMTKEALQSICEEITYITIAHDYKDGADLIKKGDEIIEKYRPSFIPKEAPGYSDSDPYPVIRWCYETYKDFNDMLSSAPYGGSSIVYPNYEKSDVAKVHAGQYYNTSSQHVPILGMECNANPEHYSDTKGYMTGNGLPDNRLFVLTVTCNYPFSSSMVKMLFNGGVNTKFLIQSGGNPPKKATGKKGTMYLLWARGAGIVNPKQKAS